MKTSVGKTKVELATGDITSWRWTPSPRPRARSCGWTTASPPPSSAPVARPSRTRPCSRVPSTSARPSRLPAMTSRRAGCSTSPWRGRAAGRRDAGSPGPRASAGRRRALPRALGRHPGVRHRRRRRSRSTSAPASWSPRRSPTSRSAARHVPAPRHALASTTTRPGRRSRTPGRRQPDLAAGAGSARASMPPSGSTAGTEQALVLLLIIAAAVAVRGASSRRAVHHRARPRGTGRRPRPAPRPTLTLSSDLVFYVFLPILLFESAYNLEARRLPRRSGGASPCSRVPGVLVAFAPHGRGRAPARAALAWGFALAVRRPDRRDRSGQRGLAVPQARGVRAADDAVDAESLFNDGAAAVLFAVVLAVVSTAWTSPPAGRSARLPVDVGRRHRRRVLPSATELRGSTGAWTTTSSRSRFQRSSPTARSCSRRRSACPALLPASRRPSCWEPAAGTTHHGARSRRRDADDGLGRTLPSWPTR